MTLQPVRDVTIDGVVVLSEDKQLDFIGPPYPDFWTSKGGNRCRPRKQFGPIRVMETSASITTFGER